jgi:hypothetical protein
MLDIILYVAAGAFIGWNFPQPFWAKYMQAQVQAWFTKKS